MVAEIEPFEVDREGVHSVYILERLVISGVILSVAALVCSNDERRWVGFPGFLGIPGLSAFLAFPGFLDSHNKKRIGKN